jgi:hypothetical protein
VPVLPAAELIENLLPAYSPCPAFQYECASAKWCPGKALAPGGGGFLGATGSIHEVCLVLLTAEPGDPLAAETYHGSPAEMLEQAYNFNYDLVAHYRDRKDRNLILRNLRRILDLAWPGFSLEDQLCRTWITDTYLRSARGRRARPAHGRAALRGWLPPPPARPVSHPAIGDRSRR